MLCGTQSKRPALIFDKLSDRCIGNDRSSLSINHWVDKGPQPLMFNPALTTFAPERMKTRRFSYFTGFAARERMREAKHVKARKSGVQPLFRQSQAAAHMQRPLIVIVVLMQCAEIYL